MRNRRYVQGAIRSSGRAATVAAAVLVSLACAGCWRGEPAPVDDPSRLSIRLSSPAFADGGMIPKGFTCDGAGSSPPLEWSGVPQSAKALVLIVEDPDAPMGTFSHWVVVNLPPGLKGLKEGVPAEAVVPLPWRGVGLEDSGLEEGVPAETDLKAAAWQGKNDFGKIGYGAPCPPSGTHHYAFRLYALDAPITLAADPPTRSEVLKAIKGHIAAEGRLVGQYARAK